MAELTHAISDSKPPPIPTPLIADGHAPVTLLSIPNELRSLIAEKLDNYSLAVLARVARHFHLIATPILYKVLSISRLQYPNPEILPRPSILTSVDQLPASLYPTTLTPDQDPIPHRFSFTETLTIAAHRSRQCKQFHPLVMPNLTTLYITHLTKNDSFRPCCECSNITKEIYERPLLSQLSPKKVIIFEPFRYIFCVPEMLDRFPTSLPKPLPSMAAIKIFVGEILLLVCPCDTARGCNKFGNFDMLPDTLRRLTLVVGKDIWGWADISDQDVPYDIPQHLRGRDNRYNGRGDLAKRIDRIGRGCCGQSKEIEIVGLETMEPREGTRGEHEELVRLAVVKHLRKKGLGSDAARAKADAVVFTELKE